MEKLEVKKIKSKVIPALNKEMSAILFIFTIVKIDYREKRKR